MAFRSNEEEGKGQQLAISKLISKAIDPAERNQSLGVLCELIDHYGPVVESYPHWHPLVSTNKRFDAPIITPSQECGYEGLDHNVFLRNAFITCPYGDGQDVLDSVERVRRDAQLERVAEISAERIETKLYHPDAHPILVKCKWLRPMSRDGTIPSAVALPLILEREVPCWRWAELAETWDTMQPYFLGQPCGSRSSLFVNQETGQIIRAVWKALIESGMYGPIKAGT